VYVPLLQQVGFLWWLLTFRPEVIVELFEDDNPNQGRRIGRVVAPWNCCDMTLDVYNEVEQEHQ
jgi:hypothetical protein